MSNKSNGQRITLKCARPNPLFQGWLEELYEEAQEKKSKLETMLKEALSSISKYPLPLKSGAECIILQGFEKKLCMYLDQRLEVYNYNLRHSEENTPSETSSTGNTNECLTNVQNFTSTSRKRNIPEASDAITLSDNGPENTPSSEVDSQNLGESDIDTISEPTSPNSSRTNKKSKRGKIYKPAHRSGAYAILVTLLELLENRPSLTKEELIENAQKHSEESFTRPKPQTYYTAWSNMTRLITKGFVKKTRSKKVTFSLTESGIQLATELLKDSKTLPTVNDIIFNKPRVVIENDDLICNDNIVACGESVIEMATGTFDVILLIDKNETGGVSKKNDPTVAQFNKYPDLKHEYRSLKVGDFTWVARHRDSKQELVLPYVIERKRMDDLGASIKDGRFHEQKFRLRKCGLDNVIYMVENYGSNKHVGLPLQSLMQALANTRVQDGFKVHITDSLTNSARFLAMMTKRLTIRFKDKTLKGRYDEPRDKEFMTFEHFNKSSSKTKSLTVTETFIKLLLQLKGLTVEKALAITSKYSTPRSLIKAYEKCDQKEGQFLLANLNYGDNSRNVGPNISKSIYQLFSSIGAD